MLKDEENFSLNDNEFSLIFDLDTNNLSKIMEYLICKLSGPFKNELPLKAKMLNNYLLKSSTIG